MRHDRRLVMIIEEAIDAQPHCVCGATMTVSAEGEAYYLHCSAPAPVGRLNRILDAFQFHDRRQIADLST